MQFEERLRDRNRWQTGDRCSLVRVMELLSTKTVFLVIRECFYGTTRFEDFVQRIGTTAPAVSRALKQLKDAGIVEPVPYREPGRRARDEYRLTAAGEDLLQEQVALDDHAHPCDSMRSSISSGPAADGTTPDTIWPSGKRMVQYGSGLDGCVSVAYGSVKENCPDPSVIAI